MTDTDDRAELKRLVPEQVRSRLSSNEKRDVLSAYQAKPGTIAAICMKASTARSPYNYFAAAVARVVDEIAQQPQPRPQRRPHELVHCLDCADTGFVILLEDLDPDARAGDAAPCHCQLGQMKQRRYGIVHYGSGQHDTVIESRPPVDLRSALDEADTG